MGSTNWQNQDASAAAGSYGGMWHVACVKWHAVPKHQLQQQLRLQLWHRLELPSKSCKLMRKMFAKSTATAARAVATISLCGRRLPLCTVDNMAGLWRTLSSGCPGNWISNCVALLQQPSIIIARLFIYDPPHMLARQVTTSATPAAAAAWSRCPATHTGPVGHNNHRNRPRLACPGQL